MKVEILEEVKKTVVLSFSVEEIEALKSELLSINLNTVERPYIEMRHFCAFRTYLSTLHV